MLKEMHSNLLQKALASTENILSPTNDTCVIGSKCLTTLTPLILLTFSISCIEFAQTLYCCYKQVGR